MLVKHQAVEPHLFRILVLVQVRVVKLGADLGVKVGVGEGEAHRLVGAVENIFSGIVDVGTLGKPHQEHGIPPLPVTSS